MKRDIDILRSEKSLKFYENVSIVNTIFYLVLFSMHFLAQVGIHDFLLLKFYHTLISVIAISQ